MAAHSWTDELNLELCSGANWYGDNSFVDLLFTLLIQKNAGSLKLI